MPVIENDKSLQTLFYAGQAALNEQLSARLANRPISNHTGSTTALSDVVPLTVFFWESMFIDQATLNGTRPVTPVGAEPAVTPSGC